MSEKPYRVHKHTDNILDVIKCGNRRVLLVTGSSDAYLITQVLNDEIAPMIEALEEKSLELMQAHERIAELEAAAEASIDTLEVLATMSYYDFDGVDLQVAIARLKEVLVKKAGGNG